MKLSKTLLFGGLLAAGLGFSFGSKADAAETYTVKSGDTLYSISQAFVGDGSLIDIIADDNDIANRNLIYVGQQLTIDADGTVDATPVQEAAQAPAPAAQKTQTTYQNTQTTQTTQKAAAKTTTSTSSATTSSAKEWIAQKESSGSYTAQNGRYYGRYQLDSSYLNGDYSAANQERVADNYVSSRYGSWEAAKSFWLANGWY
ncbi:LysM peptidoglycan-binding domain-containing protein [Enterococcus mediterraneensis]|uniref:aggregation-promoting factor n=1 Tax=Enterococcus mediterraneensis TaxID=2364791 RepID=UPI000F051A05|nr:LysM domain-containing protein [Enterococcus mediterraneensis]